MIKYSIFLISDDKAFLSFNMLKNIGFNKNDYTKVYEDNIISNKYSSIYELFEFIYFKFNNNHPIDYNYRSLSMGDVVKIDNTYWICDRYGWKDVTEYFE